MKKLKTNFVAVFLGVLFMLGILPAVCKSQEAKSDEFTLEEITVTAEKRAENVQKTALSVTAITGDTMQEGAQNTLEAVLRNIASVEIGYANRGGQINIRGIGSYVDTSLADPAVAVIEDNIYNGNSLATMGFMYDTERVEVLRGPQGTLYGRNATGGTINVVSKKPTLDKFEANGNFQVGDFNLKHFDGALNMPFSGKWAARVAVLRDTRDGYLSSGDMDSNTFGARAKLLYKANDNFSMLATYEYFWERDHGANSVPAPGSAGKLPFIGPPPNFGWTAPDIDHNGIADDFLDANGNKVAGGNGIPDLIDTGWILPDNSDPWTVDQWHPAGSNYATKDAVSIEANWDMGWGQLTAIPSFAKSYNWNVDNHLAGSSQSDDPYSESGLQSQQNQRKQYSGEVRLSSPSDSSLIWLIGYYYMKSDNTRPPEQDPTTYDDDDWHFITRNSPNSTNAIFGQSTYPVTDRFRMTGGLRFSKDNLEMEYRYGNSQVPVDHVLYDGDSIYDSGWSNFSQSFKSTTYKAGVEFDVAKDSMLYAQIATGFKQGGLNMGAPPTEFDPEKLVAYEVGSKNRFLDNHMQLNLEAFYYKYDNMQAQMPSMANIASTGGSGMIMAILNAKSGTLKGLDLEMNYLLSQNDLVNVSASFLSSELGNFIIPGPNPFGLTANFDMTGRQMSSCPKWAFTIGYEHTWMMEGGATVTTKLDTKISDGYYRTLEQWLPYAWNDGYHRSNANVTYRSSDNKWSTSTWVNNIENGAQYSWAAPFYRVQIKPPRTFGVTVSVKY